MSEVERVVFVGRVALGLGIVIGVLVAKLPECVAAGQNLLAQNAFHPGGDGGEAGFVEERAGDRREPRAAKLPDLRLREVQPLASPGHADEEQAALFFQRFGVGIGKRPFVGQQVVFDGHDEHDRVFEPLGGVQRHQGDVAGIGDRVGIGDEAGVLKEAFEERIVGVVAVEVAGGGEQFFHVGEALLVGLVPAVLPRGEVTRAGQEQSHERLDAAGRGGREIADDAGEVDERSDRFLREPFDGLRIAGGIECGDAIAVGPGQ